ncbi:MAG: ABC transporter permease, partial [Planctomycetales bacterium]|nr:ABC transporter permease [Planctomycetales bacterium]
PLSAVLAALIDFAIAFGILGGLMIWFGRPPGLSALALPLLTLLVVMAACAVGCLLAALNVAYRDFRYVVGFLMQLWMFATPSIYLAYDPPGTQPASSTLAWLLELNPMTPLIAAFRACALNQPIAWTNVGVSALAVAILLAAGLAYFHRVESSFADII